MIQRIVCPESDMGLVDSSKVKLKVSLSRANWGVLGFLRTPLTERTHIVAKLVHLDTCLILASPDISNILRIIQL